MPTHFVYDAPNKSELCQGDVLQRCGALDELLTTYFPYYQAHRDYHYFMVITQTCDLVRRDGEPCTAPYITVAAVRPVKDVLLMEAEKLQEEGLSGTNIVSAKARETLGMFLESLMDNNKPGYFYLHTDVTVGISQPCCAFLQLAVSLRAVHYDRCLEAKIAQLKEPFQAKLGWLIGNMYSRVATTEWNTEKPAEKVGAEASKILRGKVVTVDDERLKAALDDLRTDGTLTTKTPDEIQKYIEQKKLVPKINQFKDRAVETMAGMKLIEPLKGRVSNIIWQEDMKIALAALLEAQGVAEPEAVVKEILKTLSTKIRESMIDEGFPDRDKYIKDLVTDLMADKFLKSLIKP